MTSRTSAIGVDVAGDKKLTNRLLDSAGLPVPRSEVVETEDEAVAAAKRIGFPCVIKPLDGNHGRGVALDLKDEAAVRAAWPETVRQSPRRGRRRRELHHRPRLPGPRDRRQARRGRGACPGQRHRRRDQHGAPARRADQRGPPSGHRPREGADPDQARRQRGGGPRGPGLHAGRRPRAGRLRQARPHRQHVDRRHLDRPDDGGPPGQHRDRRDRGAHGRPRHRGHRLHQPRHHGPRARDRRRDRRGQRGPRASGCTPTRPRASRSTSPAR